MLARLTSAEIITERPTRSDEAQNLSLRSSLIAPRKSLRFVASLFVLANQCLRGAPCRVFEENVAQRRSAEKIVASLLVGRNNQSTSLLVARYVQFTAVNLHIVHADTVRKKMLDAVIVNCRVAP